MGKSHALELPITFWRKYGVVLLWAAVGLDLIISKLGFPIIGQCVSIVCVVLYLFENISLRKAVCSFWFGMMDLYFREISIGGQHKILQINDGRAVIFACAPHVNQFVDPIVVMKVVAEKTRRHVSWMTAAKSFTRQGIGGIAKALKAIPVVRPEDNETKGRGFLISDDKNVTGSGGTQFLADFKKGSLVVVKHPIYGKLTGKVTEVVSDTQMVLAGPFQGAPTTAKPADGEEKSFNRAMSVRTTVVMVCVFFLPFAYALPPFLPDHWWPLVYMISFQMACGFTNLLYLIYRSEDSELDVIKVTARSSLTAIGSMVRGNATKDTPSAGRKGMPRVNSRCNFDHSVNQPAKTEEAPSLKVARDVDQPSAYTFLPYVDQSEMFNNVYDALGRGGTIGIFPEGGTHDGTKLLPLKWGISTMILGAIGKYRGLKISVVPVGLNYFSPHKFRSTVSVDFGDPIEVDQSIVDLWLNGGKEEKQEANCAVMELVIAGMSAVTLQAKDVETLELYRTVRRLYLPLGTRLSVADNVALTQSVAAGFRDVTNSHKCDSRLQDFHARCSEYSQMLSQYNLHDYQVQRFKDKAFSETARNQLLLRSLMRLVSVLSFSIILVPWYLSVAPATMLLAVMSDWQARKVNKMSVKGTWKILGGTVVLPIMHCWCTACFWATFGEFGGLVWFFIAPMGGMLAIFAAEEAALLIKSLKGLLFIVRNTDAGQKLSNIREELKSEVRELIPALQALEMDHGLRVRLEKRQSWLDSNTPGE
eukprot:CAMPEP_0179434102 /NCGR_PEP_ID=MMETSP0799-20121207/18417_1 /TAXON_ID=46947 /ORGANISM="Geminigera cryophila, Strain CCMP2564" /LENGTH=759 /DNA_ID=CAMNT_0021212547 /DNA_START=240 /DNA_END=2519 /DNA_ORIENTATION=-